MPNARKAGKPSKSVTKALIHWCESAKRPCRAACGQDNPGSYDSNIQHVTCVKCRNAAKKNGEARRTPTGQEEEASNADVKSNEDVRLAHGVTHPDHHSRVTVLAERNRYLDLQHTRDRSLVDG